VAYIVQSDLVSAVGNSLLAQLFSDGGGGISAALVTEAIADAEADVNTILGPGYTVPMTGSIPRVVKRCCVDLAIFYGYERKPEFRRPQSSDNPEQKRYDRAQKMLRELKSGERSMGSSTAPTAAAVGGTTYAPAVGDRFILDDIEHGPF
jgi:phage gp36-like protein